MNTSDLIPRLVRAILANQDAVERFDTAAADALAVNATDMRCLAMLDNQGSLTPGDIARQLALTRGATTTALDRLEHAALVTRRPSADDGRSVRVQLTEHGCKKVRALWALVRRLGREHLESYTARELELLTRFFERSAAVQEAALDRIAIRRR